METLKPCPFCGSDAEVYEYTFGDSSTPSYSIRCLSDECCMSPDIWVDEDEIPWMIAQWNTRQEENNEV